MIIFSFIILNMDINQNKYITQQLKTVQNKTVKLPYN